jgi:hypothetical protein
MKSTTSSRSAGSGRRVPVYSTNSGAIPGRSGPPVVVPVVEPHHVPPAGGQALTELVRPPQHRGRRAVHQQDRRVRRVAEALHAQVHAVRPDHPRV